MLIKWLGHSCFKIYAGAESLVIDPYADGSVDGLLPLRETANVVLTSHGHGDHNAVGNVQLYPQQTGEFEIERIETFHDDKEGSLRGKNTIHIIIAEGYRLAHLGDLGCMLDYDQIQQLSDLDVLMIPVGGFYTIDGRQAASLVKKLKPRVIIPMHYRGDGFGYPVLARVEDFTRYFENVIYLDSDSIELSDELNNEVVVLDYKQHH